MADLTYDAERLSTLATQLTTITDDLKSDRDLKGYDVQDVAHEIVAEAIDNFVNDWDDRRNKLVEKVETLADMASKSAEQFTQADLELAASLTEEKA